MFNLEIVTLARLLIDEARERSLRIVTAESCTGGLVSGAICSIPGASDVFERGFITYTNRAKQEMLGVPGDLIADLGAVSEPVARMMAEGALEASNAHLAVAITGVAGPGGGTRMKPMGTVHIATARANQRIVHTEHFFEEETREGVQLAAVQAALQALRDRMVQMSLEAEAADRPNLVRALRRRDLVGLLLNAMMGAGMLAAPAKVYGLTGDWSFAVLAASALILVPLILCFADLGSRFSVTGGPYIYARQALPPVFAFSVGWLLWFSQALSVATLSNLLVSYLAGFVPGLEQGWPRLAVIGGLGLAFTAIVLTGIRQSASASNLLIVLKVGFVLGFLAAGIAFVAPERLTLVSAPPPPATLAQAILIYLFAYSGFERAAVMAGEANDPRRDVPMALMGSVAVVTLAYGAVLLVCVGVLAAPAATDRPLAEVGRQLFGVPGAVAVTLGAGAVILGTILVIIVSMPRMLLALSEQGQLPAVLGRVHPRWRTPWVAILLSSGLSFGFAIFSDVLGALTFATATRLVGYILCCIALFRLSRRPYAPPPQFRLRAPGFVSLGTAALFTGVLLLGALKEFPPLLVVLAIGLVLMGLTRWMARRAP